MHLNSNVPTAELANNGVNRKWFVGETKVIGTSLFMLIAILNPPQPHPKITTSDFCVADDNEDDDDDDEHVDVDFVVNPPDICLVVTAVEKHRRLAQVVCQMICLNKFIE
jgi:hypothetical protein